MENCIFCKIIKGEIEAKKVYEDEKFIAFRDVTPQAPVHIVIIPKEHIPKLYDTKSAELLGEILILINKLANTEGISESGYRVVINTNRESGQSVDHLHFHLMGGRVMNWPPG